MFVAEQLISRLLMSYCRDVCPSCCSSNSLYKVIFCWTEHMLHAARFCYISCSTSKIPPSSDWRASYGVSAHIWWRLLSYNMNDKTDLSHLVWEMKKMWHSFRPFTDSAVWLRWDSCEWSLWEEEGWIEGEGGGDGGRDGGYVTLRFRSASRELVCLWLILSGRGGDGEETEGGRDGGDRMEERRSLLSYLPSFSILPSLMSDVIQVTYSSSSWGSLPPLLSV